MAAGGGTLQSMARRRLSTPATITLIPIRSVSVDGDPFLSGKFLAGLHTSACRLNALEFLWMREWVYKKLYVCHPQDQAAKGFSTLPELHNCQCPLCFTEYVSNGVMTCQPKCDLNTCDEATGICAGTAGDSGMCPLCNALLRSRAYFSCSHFMITYELQPTCCNLL